jgi:hyperosmotically inducible protein
MVSSRLSQGFIVALALFNLGCRQEVPKPPRTPPTPTTSAPSVSTTASPKPENTEDAIVTGKVKAELLKASDGKNVEIDVQTQNGVVSLTGFARSNSDIDSAVEIAKKVEGVKGVKHKLAVKPS